MKAKENTNSKKKLEVGFNAKEYENFEIISFYNSPLGHSQQVRAMEIHGMGCIIHSQSTMGVGEETVISESITFVSGVCLVPQKIKKDGFILPKKLVRAKW